MAKPQVRAVYSTDFAPQNNAVAPPKAAPVNEKAVVKQWFKRVLFSALKKLFFMVFFINLGSFLEYKYHWLGSSAQANVQAAKKGGK